MSAGGGQASGGAEELRGCFGRGISEGSGCGVLMQFLCGRSG